MKTPIAIICLFLLLCSNKMMSQDFSSHQWKNRILVIKTNNDKNETYVNQVNDLIRNKIGLTDRKVIVYRIYNRSIIKDLKNHKDWKEIKINHVNKTNLLKSTELDFEIILIGLDGQVKLRKSEFLDCKNLFSIIDVMPMRRQELENRN